jgi:hypothetical protein
MEFFEGMLDTTVSLIPCMEHSFYECRQVFEGLYRCFKLTGVFDGGFV